MLNNEIFNAMELLTKEDLINISKSLKLNTKIKTYDNNGKSIDTKIDYCKYDLIKLIKSYFLNKDTTIGIIYHDYITPVNNFNDNTLITFRNVKKVKSTISKLYKKYFNINFEYDKLSYNILSSRWAHGETINIKTFITEHFNSKRFGKSDNTLIDNDRYEKTKKQIISSINEYINYTSF